MLSESLLYIKLPFKLKCWLTWYSLLSTIIIVLICCVFAIKLSKNELYLPEDHRRSVVLASLGTPLCI